MTENISKNLLCVISIEAFGEHKVHDIQTNSSWVENPYPEGYAIVPDNLVQDILATKGYCDTVLNDNETEVASFTARDIPETVETEAIEIEPTAEELLNAMIGGTSYEQ